jgi:hypothetical protein
MRIWKIREIRRAFEGGRGKMPLCREDILFEVLERKSGRYEFLNSKWLIINKEVAYRIIMIRVDTTDLGSSWKLLQKGRCKWENNIRNVG